MKYFFLLLFFAVSACASTHLVEIDSFNHSKMAAVKTKAVKIVYSAPTNSVCLALLICQTDGDSGDFKKGKKEIKTQAAHLGANRLVFSDNGLGQIYGMAYFNQPD
jgi:hypothetical protein